MNYSKLYDGFEESAYSYHYQYDPLFLHLADFIRQQQRHPPDIPAYKTLLTQIKNDRHYFSHYQKSKFCAGFYSDATLLNYYFGTLYPPEQSLIRQLTWKGPVDYATAKTLLGNPAELLVFYKKDNSFRLTLELAHWQPFLSANLRYLTNSGSRATIEEQIRQQKITFQFPEFIREAFASILPMPEEANLRPIPLPKNSQLCSFEEDIFEELPNILLLRDQGLIKITRSGFMNIPSVKAVHKKLGSRTFPGEDGHIKAWLIAGFVYEPKELLSLPGTVDMIRFIFEKQTHTYAMIDALLFPFGGIRSIDLRTLNPGALASAFDLLHQLPAEGWIGWDNIQLYASAHYFDFDILSQYRIRELIPTGGNPRAGIYNTASTPVKLKLIREQLITGILLTAAAFGLVELAYEVPAKPKKAASRQGLTEVFSACRLTALGAHILKGEAGYQIPEAAQPIGYALDPAALRIKVTGNMEMAAGLLKDWTVQKGNDILLVDTESIIANSRSKEDLLRQLRQFNKALGMELPAFWKEALMKIIYQTSALYTVPSALVFRLSPHDKKLHRHIAQDELLRNITLKAEAFTVIVDSDDVPLFIKRLAQLGYLTDGTRHVHEPKEDFMQQTSSQSSCIEQYNLLINPIT